MNFIVIEITTASFGCVLCCAMISSLPSTICSLLTGFQLKLYNFKYFILYSRPVQVELTLFGIFVPWHIYICKGICAYCVKTCSPVYLCLLAILCSGTMRLQKLDEKPLLCIIVFTFTVSEFENNQCSTITFFKVYTNPF